MLKTLTADINSGLASFKETAQALLSNGFTPIPLVDGQKRPATGAWQRTSRADIPRLIESHGDTRSTGLLLGAPDDSGYWPIAIDFDIHDEGLAEDLWQDGMVQRGGPIRIGQAPKFLQLFKTRDPRLLRKRQSPVYIDDAGRKNQIEILGAGQQCVVSGIHPATGQPYRWQDHGGTLALGPFGLNTADLPEIDAEGVDVLFMMLEVYATMLRDMEGGSTTTPDSAPPVGELTEGEETDRLLYLAGKRRGITLEEAEEALQWIPAGGYDNWVKGGMALKFEFQGSPEALDLYDRWSASAPNYAGRAGVEVKWRSFDELPMDREPVTWGTITHMKEEAIRTGDVGPDITREELAEAQERLSPREPGPRRQGFHLLHIGEVVRDIRPAAFLIDGVIETETMGELFGDPGCGKTFMALDMILCVSSGRPWHGHAVKQGPVVYIVGEGRQGIARRLRAWGLHHGVDLDDLPFFISSAPAALTDPESAAEVAETIAEIAAQHGPPAMIVIDTLARNFGPGDENSTKDMTTLIANLDRYLGTDCVRLIVHHSGHGDKSRSRGNSALKGAVDFQYSMAWKNGLVEMACTKQKDGPAWQKPKQFKPHTVLIGEDVDGPIESIVLESIDFEDSTPAGSGQMQEALNLLRELYDHHREALAASGKDPSGARVTKAEWRDACVERGIYTRTAFYRMMAAAEERTMIETDPTHVFLRP